MSFDIEDIADLKLKPLDDTIELPESDKTAYINEIIQEHDFDVALDLISSDLLVDSTDDNEIDIMTFCPGIVASFKKYEKKILDFYHTVPDDIKPQFSMHLIQKLIYPLSSFQLADILEQLPDQM